MIELQGYKINFDQERFPDLDELATWCQNIDPDSCSIVPCNCSPLTNSYNLISFGRALEALLMPGPGLLSKKIGLICDITQLKCSMAKIYTYYLLFDFFVGAPNFEGCPTYYYTDFIHP